MFSFFIFHWQGISKHGKKLTGFVAATHKKHALINHLETEGTVVTDIKKQLHFKQSLNLKELIVFTREFYNLLKSGMTLLTVLRLILENTSSIHKKLIIQHLIHKIENGLSLSSALKDFPKTFDAIYLQLIVCGEQSGDLERSFHLLVTFLERQWLYRMKITKALTYPLFVLVISVVITIGLLVFVIPELQKVFMSFDHRLPKLTAVIFKCSSLIRHCGYWFLVIISPMFFFRHKADVIQLHIPFVRHLRTKHFAFLWCRLLSMSTTSGLSLVEAQTLAIASLPYYQKQLSQVLERVRAGESLAANLYRIPFISPTTQQLLSLGESCGSFAATLDQAANLLHTELDHQLDRLCQLLEPLVMVFLSLFIGLLIVAMYLPIFQISNIM